MLSRVESSRVDERVSGHHQLEETRQTDVAFAVPICQVQAIEIEARKRGVCGGGSSRSSGEGCVPSFTAIDSARTRRAVRQWFWFLARKGTRR